MAMMASTAAVGPVAADMSGEDDNTVVKRQPFSFQIKKKVENKVFDNNKSAVDENVSKDYVLFVEDKEISSTKPKEEKKELVIPLIKNNVWRVPKKKDSEKGEDPKKDDDLLPKDDEKPSLDELAVRELVSEALREEGTDTDKPKNKVAIPLVMQNKIPDGFETDEKIDVSLRPDESTLEDYERVPIEEYGLAVLRGMGWKPGAPVGGVNKKCVNPVEVIIRPQGLGLGADRSIVEQAKKQNTSTGDNVSEELQLMKGSCVKVKHGQKKGLYGQVEGLDQENARVVLRLALGGKVVSVPEFAVQVVTKKEYSKEAKCINSEKFKAVACERSKEKRKSSHHHRATNPDEESTDSYGHKKKRKHHHPNTDHSRHGSSDYESESQTWVLPDLRVRFIDKEFKSGKYFNNKLIVEQVASYSSISCRTEEGKLLNNIETSMLETVIPRKEPAIVKIVQGKYRQKLGRIMERDKTNCIATVELLSQKHRILKLDYDSICEYAGRIPTYKE